MSATPDRLKYLLGQFAANKLTEAEFGELFSVMGEHEKEVKAALMENLEVQSPVEYNRAYWMKKFREMMAGRNVETTTTLHGKRGKVQKMLTKVAVAASILLVLVTGYWLVDNKMPDDVRHATAKLNDIKAPATNLATITLTDGRKVYLDSAANGTLVTAGNMQIVKLADGKIAYSQGSAASSQEMVYNTLSNPRGSKAIDIILADGSHVWLNAGSSVTFPLVFTGRERRVSITGEAYFEVTHNTKPFYVSKGNVDVQVLGTQFNVNAYDDENNIKVTLLEGSVKTSMINGESSILKPGEQAQVAAGIKVMKGVDTEQVMAWKNGKFSFNNTDIKTIMREIMRWYDVDVIYEGDISDRYFTADISRDKNLASMLKIFELNKIHFRIEGKKLIVMP